MPFITSGPTGPSHCSEYC